MFAKSLRYLGSISLCHAARRPRHTRFLARSLDDGQPRTPWLLGFDRWHVALQVSVRGEAPHITNQFRSSLDVTAVINSYKACDSGILPNQTYVNKTGPEGAINAHGPYSKQYDNKLSFLPGMRTPGCTCSGGDHPGPNNNVGRSAPELDIIEAQIQNGGGEASQSLQTAPYDKDYAWDNSTAKFYGGAKPNTYTGSVYQEAVSGVAPIPDDAYNLTTNNRFVTFALEYSPDWDGNGKGSVTWYIDGEMTWQVTGASIGPDPSMDISQRLIPTEPMVSLLG